MEKGVLTSYLVLILVVFIVFITHAFKLYDLQVDKYTFFLTSLFFTLLILPAVKALKFFDIIEIRREYKSLKKKLNGKN